MNPNHASQCGAVVWIVWREYVEEEEYLLIVCDNCDLLLDASLTNGPKSILLLT